MPRNERRKNAFQPNLEIIYPLVALISMLLILSTAINIEYCVTKKYLLQNNIWYVKNIVPSKAAVNLSLNIIR